MPNNTPITDAELAEVRRLHAAATPGDMSVDRYHTLLDKDDKHVLFTGIQIPMTAGERQRQARANMAEYAALHNAFPGLDARLEAAEREREELREELAYIKQQLEWVEENGDTYQKSALMDFIRRTLHGLSHTAAIKEAIAARDAQQRREGAVEELTEIANGCFGDSLFLPDRTHYTKTEVREILEQAAKRLREGGE